MHVKLINKRLLFDKHKIKCAIGKKGLSSSKKEGDFTTPKGKFKFLNLFFRKDKIKVKTKLKKIIIKKNMGWCDDISSKFYNRLIKLPFRYKYEKLFRSDNIYDIFIVINYKTKQKRKKKEVQFFYM